MHRNRIICNCQLDQIEKEQAERVDQVEVQGSENIWEIFKLCKSEVGNQIESVHQDLFS